ncbi:DUF2845 domain-containing protein [Anaeromyxobacter oryzisoli]|uniref:DUF2845 domain-containing protein n=1 Tax=Anaeromyxobacter oryzisoli TaxID=2925408 RepID=UPI001F59F228|nr:DUF2845 domain-containing protein [Anaeromyxobacter sp. SG63]
MRRLVRRLAALSALALAASADASESSVVCDGGRVAVGDLELDLRAKCGEPALRDARDASTVVVAAGAGAITGGGASAVVEQWTYDFGPNRFLALVTLEAGRITLIERGGYGYGRVQPARGSPAQCDTSRVRPGDVKLDLLARCGEPATRHTRREQRPVPAGGGATAFVSVEVEVWTYDPGPQRFVSIVTLEDGRVVSVDRGGYGHAR